MTIITQNGTTKIDNIHMIGQNYHVLEGKKLLGHETYIATAEGRYSFPFDMFAEVEQAVKTDKVITTNEDQALWFVPTTGDARSL